MIGQDSPHQGTSRNLLEGKSAVVPGGSSGIGLATAKRFVEEGATVVVKGRNRAQLARGAAEDPVQPLE
jgi:NAD(P)-dependent dehydrogenase (short-subunit alcohol dehydrogenase family)